SKSKETIMNLPKHLLPTTVVGSYPQPERLVDRAMLSKLVPRTRMHAMWRLPAEHLEEAQDDATIVAIRDMECAGIDIVTDGEIRRESYSNRFATALEGIDDENPAMITSRSGHATPVPRVVGPVKRRGPVELHDMEFLRKNTDRAAKITLPTVVHLCFGYAAVVPGSTKPAGYSFLAELADTSAEQISIEAAQPKLDLGVLKDLSSKKIMLGVLDLGNPEIEPVEIVADR